MAYNLLPRPTIAAVVIGVMMGGCASVEPKDDTALAVEEFEMDRNTCREQADRLNGSAGNNALAGLFVGVRRQNIWNAKRLKRGRFIWPSPADGVVSFPPSLVR